MKPQRPVKLETPKATQPRVEEEKKLAPTVSASGKWTAVQRVRMPHKMGLPLGSGGCGDSIER
jgi:hypothetical protein